MADAQDLKSWVRKKPCRFESDHRHHLEVESSQGNSELSKCNYQRSRRATTNAWHHIAGFGDRPKCTSIYRVCTEWFGCQVGGILASPITSVVLLKLPNRNRSASEHRVYAFSMTANPAQMNRLGR